MKSGVAMMPTTSVTDLSGKRMAERYWLSRHSSPEWSSCWQRKTRVLIAGRRRAEYRTGSEKRLVTCNELRGQAVPSEVRQGLRPCLAVAFAFDLPPWLSGRMSLLSMAHAHRQCCGQHERPNCDHPRRMAHHASTASRRRFASTSRCWTGWLRLARMTRPISRSAMKAA